MSETTGTMTQRERRADMLERFEQATDLPLLFLALVMVPILLIPFVTDVSSDTDNVFEGILWTIWAVFAVELTVRTYLSERRVDYLVRHWYDVLIVVVPFLRPLRIARSARALRLLRLGRVTPFLVKAWAEVHDILRKRGLQYVILFGVIIVLSSAGIVMAFESSGDGPIDDYGTALWWAMQTVTTVGYGDEVPTTPEGRGVAVLLMVVGIAFFSWLTANIAAFLVEFGGIEGVTTQDLMAKLESMDAEIKALRAERNPSVGGSDAVQTEILEHSD
ncbi:MAG: potassium channel family protein [Dehalococcoidia bacterium]